MSAFNFLENHLAQKWPEENIRFSRIFHSSKFKAGAALTINRARDGARGYLIHAITISYGDPGVNGFIKINNEEIVRYNVTVAMNNCFTHNFFHYHEGTVMRFTEADPKLVYTVHYQYITFGNPKKEK